VLLLLFPVAPFARSAGVFRTVFRAVAVVSGHHQYHHLHQQQAAVAAKIR